MNKIIYTTFSPHLLTVSKAKESFIWDEHGRKLIDFTSGWNVTNLGWNNSELIEAGIKQFNKNTYVPMWASEKIQEQYADKLLGSIGREYGYVARATSGMEGIEMAIKTARVYTGKKKILSFLEQYHGGSINALSLSYRNEWMSKLADNLKAFTKLEYPNTYRTVLSDKDLLSHFESSVEAELSTGEYACVITEAGIVTGWGSTYLAPDGYIEVIDKLCKKFNVLLILDEVGTGFSRIGSLFAIHQFKISPDIIVLAKAIANGTQTIAAMVTKKEVMINSYKGSNLQSTFGWNPVACAVALKTLEIHQREEIWKSSSLKGRYIKNYLKENLKANPYVGDIRGMGMEIGLDLVKNKSTKEKNTELLNNVVAKSYENGLHLVSDHESNIQLMPPLVTTKEVLKEGLEILIESIQHYTH